jgi:hypothetical protein
MSEEDRRDFQCPECGYKVTEEDWQRGTCFWCGENLFIATIRALIRKAAQASKK